MRTKKTKHTPTMKLGIARGKVYERELFRTVILFSVSMKSSVLTVMKVSCRIAPIVFHHEIVASLFDVIKIRAIEIGRVQGSLEADNSILFRTKPEHGRLQRAPERGNAEQADVDIAEIELPQNIAGPSRTVSGSITKRALKQDYGSSFKRLS